MPMIDFKYGGFVRGATVNEAYDKDGNKVDVSKMSVFQLVMLLNKGELTIELEPHLSDHTECEINMEDYTASRYRDRSIDG